jgi:response regulator RpfG family c-di-GMP phosphodiesterase
VENSVQKKIKVLYIDDEEINLRSFKAVLRMKFDIYITSVHQDALNLIAEHQIPIIFSDQRMPEMLGTEFLKLVAQKFPDTKRVLLTGYTDFTDLIIAVNEGKIAKYLTKPWDATELENTIIELNEEYVYIEKLKEFYKNNHRE